MTSAPLPSEPVPAVSALGLHRFFRRGEEEVAALRDVSLDVLPGEVVAVVGPSGSGKTTLLNLLAGLDRPDAGVVRVGGRRLSHQSMAEQARLRGRHIGVMTQTSGLVEHLSLLDNVRLAGSFRAPGGGSAAAAREALQALGLAERFYGRPSTLSGGETARANLAVALVGDPDVVLADEPTAEVSRPEERQILELLRVTHHRAGVVLVTHSDAVAAFADRVVSLRDGRVQ